MFKRYASATVMEVLPKGTLTSIASANSEQPSFDYDPENFVYFRCRAISADVTNGNGDYFPADELLKSYASFIGVGLYKDHDSDSIDKAIGKVLWAEWVKSGSYVECICAVDRVLAPDLARRVESGIATSVSMGCSVKSAECSVDGCHNIASNPQNLCDHMQPGFGVKGHMGPDGKVIYEINRGIQFTELSLVTVPADPTARIFEIYAELNKRKASMSAEKFAKELSRVAELAAPGKFAQLCEYIDALKKSSLNSPIEEKASVVNNQTFTEKKMALTIEYQKGSNLSTSFFVAKDGSSNYRVAASEVLPLIVQSAISRNEPGIATPEQLISDLNAKLSSVRDFKAWAKRRRHKNRKAAAKSNTDTSVESIAMNEISAVAKDEKKPVPVAAKPGDKPALKKCDEKACKDGCKCPSKKEDAKGGDMKKATLENSTDGLEKVAEVAVEVAAEPVVEAVAETPATEAVAETAPDAVKILAAFDALRKFVEAKFANGIDKTATQVVPSQGHTDGDHGDKAVASPKAIQEVVKTENPKGGMEKGAAKTNGIEVKAMNKDWSIDPKELEKAPKAIKSKTNMPPVVSVDEKELNGESMSVDHSGNAGAQVKKLFNRLPSKGAGEAEKALDAKSSADPEKAMLRKALEEERAKNNRHAEKEKLQAVADKIYEIVAELQSKNIVAAGKEEMVIDALTKKFANLEALESLKSLVGHFSKQAASESSAVAVDASEKSEIETGGVVPQVFESVEGSEDAISKLSQIWNL